MKKYLFALITSLALVTTTRAQALNAKMSAAEPKSPKFLWVTFTTGTSNVFSATDLQFTTATFYGYKFATNNAAPTANSNPVYIGYNDAAGAALSSAGTPAIVDTITAGSWLGINTTGTKYNLKDFYGVGTTGDKLLIVYEQ